MAHGHMSIAGRKAMGGSRAAARSIDEGYVVAGRTKSFGAGAWDFWVLRLDRNGNIPDCDLMGTSTATVVDTEVAGESATVTVEETTIDAADSHIDPVDSDASVETQCYHYQPPRPPVVPAVFQWGTIGMIIALAGCLVWALRRRRVTSTT